MQFSRDWLLQYLGAAETASAASWAAADLARRLTFAGFAVDKVTAAAVGDELLEIDVTTNRPDCMNHLGLARELAVLLDRPLVPPPAAVDEGGEPVTTAAAVDVEDQGGCPRFVARVVRGVRIGPSPEWLRRRLEAIGARPIYNVVDVTNYVLWEMGQPMHAYDLSRLAGRRLVVRRARPGERLVTLDGVLRELTVGMLVIADAERPIGLAGVMGGRDTEVTEQTTDLLLESAHFERRAVRVAAKGLGMHTDASHRFERGADLEACRAAADRAAALIAELAGGTVLRGAIDRRAAPPPPRAGRLELARLQGFAGATLAPSDVERWLTGLGFAPRPVASAAGLAWEVTVPSWRYYDFEPRPDGRIYDADLYEEVLRINGFDRIPSALPVLAGSDGPPAPLQRLRDEARDYLAAAGFAEAINLAFVDQAADAELPTLRPETRPLALANPLSERLALLRRSLAPNLVAGARFNQRRGAGAVRLFEIGRVFFPAAGAAPAGGEAPVATLAAPAAPPSPPLADEPEHVALVCGGRPGSPWEREVDLDLFDLKGAVEGLAASRGITLEVRPASLPGLATGEAAELRTAAGALAGWLGRVAAAAEGYPLYAAELALEPLLAAGEAKLAVRLPSRFPGIPADLTLTHSLAVPWAEIESFIASPEARPPDLVSFALKDRYRGPGVPAGAVNSTLSFLYNAGDRSLTQEEVNERQLHLAAALERRFGQDPSAEEGAGKP